MLDSTSSKVIQVVTIDSVCSNNTKAKQSPCNVCSSETSARFRKHEHFLKDTFSKLANIRQEIFLRPQCIIQTAQDGKLYFEENVLKQIEKIDVPLVVVAVAGLYRTGKSYLMNRLAGCSDGFPLGSTIQSKTKGIWVWCRKHPELKNTVLLLLDTEGLGDVAKGDQGHDNRIFTLAVLLCNVLVYNMMTVFNQDAVEKLTFISEMSKNIKFKNKTSTYNQDDQLELILPTFVLCLRDFTLDLEIDEREISADEYLEDCLQLKPGKGPDIERYNRPRESIRKYFPVRKCFTFDSPGNKKIIKQLEKLSLEELSETFVEETQKFLRYVYERKPKVLLHSKSVTGNMFVQLVKSYVNAIRAGAVPDVDDAISVVANIENERMAKLAVEEFTQQIKHVKLPVLQAEELDSIRNAIQSKCLAYFRKEAVFNGEKFEISAIAEMDKLWEQIKTKNVENVKQHCKAILKEIYNNVIGRKMLDGGYRTPGGHMEYKADIGKIKSAYRRNVAKVEDFLSQNVWTSFVEEEADNETDILMADQKLTAEDRKREIENMQRTHEDAQRQQQEMFERKMDEERKRTEEHMRQLEEEREECRRIEEEKLALLTEQNRQQRELSERQIEMMKEENKLLREEHKDAIENLKVSFSQKEEETKQHFQKQHNQMYEMMKSKDLEMKTILAQRDKEIADGKRKTAAVEQQRRSDEEKRRKEMIAEKQQMQAAHQAQIERLEDRMRNTAENDREQRQKLQEEIDALKKGSCVIG